MSRMRVRHPSPPLPRASTRGPPVAAHDPSTPAADEAASRSCRDSTICQSARYRRRAGDAGRDPGTRGGAGDSDGAGRSDAPGTMVISEDTLRATPLEPPRSDAAAPTPETPLPAERVASVPPSAAESPRASRRRRCRHRAPRKVRPIKPPPQPAAAAQSDARRATARGGASTPQAEAETARGAPPAAGAAELRSVAAVLCDAAGPGAPATRPIRTTFRPPILTRSLTRSQLEAPRCARFRCHLPAGRAGSS